MDRTPIPPMPIYTSCQYCQSIPRFSILKEDHEDFVHVCFNHLTREIIDNVTDDVYATISPYGGTKKSEAILDALREKLSNG